MMMEMDSVFRRAKDKAASQVLHVGNTPTPWRDFTPEHLEKRLNDEIKEWRESGDIAELLDVINLAAFLYLSKQRAEGG